MGLISRVSSRTYGRRKISIMPDQAVNSNSRSASYAKKVLYKRKRWTTSGEKKAAEKNRPSRTSPAILPSRPRTTTIQNHRCRQILPSHPKIEGRNRSRFSLDLGCWSTPRKTSRFLETTRIRIIVGYRSIQDQWCPTPTSQPEIRYCHFYQIGLRIFHPRSSQ